MGDPLDGSDMPVKIEFEGSVIVPVTPSAAFVIADMASLAAWNPAVAESHLVAGQPMEIGAQYSCTLARGPMRLRVSPVLVDVVPDERVAYAGRFGFAHSQDSIEFRAEGEGTRVTFRNTSAMPGWARPLRWAIAKAFHQQAQRSVDGAHRYLAEGSSTS